MSGCGMSNLHFVIGIANAVKYRNILEQELPPSILRLQYSNAEYIFQQNGASCHTARSTMVWLTAEAILYWNGLPAALIFHQSKLFGTR